MADEVQKLLKAGFIREVKYPCWLANTVCVKKKTGDWRVCIDFIDLNKACPKDSFALPKVDQLIDSISRYARLSIFYAFSSYHQIPMAEHDQEKTGFITLSRTYCYKVMPFRLKNARATYQRLVTRMFDELIGKNLEAYVDDTIVKSTLEENHLADLTKAFARLRQFGMKLNAKKSSFRVSLGKFLGHLVSRRGIEANPSKIKAIKALKTPIRVREVQKLNGMVAALTRFISRSSDKCHPFFQDLKKRRNSSWNLKCQEVYQQLVAYLEKLPTLTHPYVGETLFLYLAISAHSLSGVLVAQRNNEQKPIYYVSKTLLDAETRYLPLEKLLLALVTVFRKLQHYFHSHPIIMLTNFPLKDVLRRVDLSGQVSKWGVELNAYNIDFSLIQPSRVKFSPIS